MQENGTVHGLDISKPNIARVYDYWLGGKNNFAADRELAARMAALYPPWVQTCRDNRAFVGRAVTWAAREGIGQFVDLGAGLPTSPSVHEAARAVDPGARVCYVDNDPIVVAHADALLAGPVGIAAAEADLARPEAVWDSPALRAVIDPAEPVCVIFAFVLHFYDAERAQQVAAAYAAGVAPGSVFIVSTGRCDDPDMWRQVTENYTAGVIHNHDRDDVLSFLDGLDVVPPGVALAHAWRAGMTGVPERPRGAAYALGAVGVKP